jgi:hypothetical protein
MQHLERYWMRLVLLSLMAALIVADTARAAPADPQLPLVYLEAPPEQLVEAAFSAPFGKLLVAQLAIAIGADADAACLQAKGIDKAALGDRARAIMVRNGAQSLRKYLSTVDQSAFKARFAESMGPDAEAELTRLRSDKDVRAFLELGAPARDAAIALNVVETFGRIVMLLKINLSRRFDPISSGDAALLGADPTESTSAKVEAFVQSSTSPALTRYLDLTDAAQQALNRSLDTKLFLSLRIVDLMPDLEQNLADVCVLRRK